MLTFGEASVFCSALNGPQPSSKGHFPARRIQKPRRSSEVYRGLLLGPWHHCDADVLLRIGYRKGAARHVADHQHVKRCIRHCTRFLIRYCAASLDGRCSAGCGLYFRLSRTSFLQWAPQLVRTTGRI
jgi:hypothetical protein